MIQSRDLAMTALGSQGQVQRWFGPPLEEGVHLRWTFRSTLGFPFGGFRLSRRPHISGTWVDLPVASGATDIIELPEVARAVRVEFTNPFWLPFRPAPKAVPAAVALFDGFESGAPAASLSRARATVSIEQDAITAVRLTTPRRWKLQRLRYIPVAQDEHVGWSDLRPICLPLTDPHYHCRAGPTNVAFDFEDAKARLAVDGIADPLVLAQYLPADEWPQFHDHMRALCNPPIPATLTFSPSIEDEPAVNISTVDWMLLGAIDPYFARIIGVYVIDRTASGSQTWDYKVAGRWLKSQLKAPEETFDFEGDRLKRRHPHTFVRENLIVRTAHRGEVEVLPDPPWQDTRHALNLQPYTPSPVLHAPSYLRIQFEQPVAEAQLYLCVHLGEPQLRASASGAVLSRWKSPDGKFLIVSAAAATKEDKIEFVTIDPGPGSGDIHLSLCKVGVLNEWSAPMTEERSWITYDVSLTAPPALQPPTGLVVVRQSAVSRELPNDLTGSSPLAALRWDVPTTGVLQPREPLRYIIERQSLGSGNTPAAIADAAWEPVNLDAPVGIPADDAPPDLHVDDPSLPTGSADRFYAYRVAAVDLFGRISAFSSPFVADLSDREPPPPPANVVATYVHDSHALHVRWDWTPSQRRQAPDAREFSVYAQRGRLNTITGLITAVSANADGSFIVKTDRTLPANGTNALAGEWLLSDDVYCAVVENTAGDHFQITVRPPAAPPPARPLEGAFTVSIRPPRVLDGTVTKARSHLSGSVTLHTDQHTDLAADALAGKWLQQGGRLYRILSNTTGERFRLLVMGRGRPAISPGKGKFTIVEADRTTPFLLDPGNVLHVDYGRAENWPEPVHTEPLVDPIVGQITSVVIDGANGTSVLTINAPVGESATQVSGGMVSNAGQVFRVVGWSDGPPFTMTVENFTIDGTTFVPVTGGFEYHGYYEVTIAYDLEPAGEGVAYGHVAVSTTDENENEGALSAPLQVQTPQPPPVVQRPDAPTVSDSTTADYYGHSVVDVQWELIDGMHVHVYRALDEAIAAADRSARPTRSQQRAAYTWLTDAQFESLVLAQPAYDSLSDEDVAMVAGLPGNDGAFGLITHAPVTTDVFGATINGRPGNRHCFAIKYIDPAGNRSALSWPSRCLRPARVLAPRRPVITKIESGNRAITLQWTHTGANADEYRVYRAEHEGTSFDLRLMQLVATVPAIAADAGEIAWTDTSISSSTPVYYRVLVMDHDGNLSPPTDAVPARAFDESRPAPPDWNPVERDESGPAVSLSWHASSADLTCMVERRDSDGGLWTPVSRWLPRGSYVFADVNREPGLTYDYRVRVRDARGRQNDTFNILAEV